MKYLPLRSLAAALALTALGASASDDAGTVLLSVGGVTVERGGNGAVALGRGTVLKSGDRITTRDGSHVHVRLRDGGLVAVRPNSVFEIALFEYDPAQPQAGKVRYQLKTGVVRSVTGQVGEINKDAFRLNTPVAAIGVRGTDFVAASDDIGTRVAVRSGSVIVASLGEGCSAEGLGACTQNGLLMAANGQGGLVEVSVNDRVPRFRKEQVEDLLPDRKSPALSSEPVASGGSEKREESRSTVADAAAGGALPLQVVAQATPPAPVVVPQPVVVPLPVVPVAVHWGRWDGNAQPAELPTAQALMLQGKPIQIATNRFALGVDSVGDIFLQRGNASFNVFAADAFVYTPSSITRAAVEGGKLNIQFDARTFDTAFTVVEQNGTRNDLLALGTIVRGGYLVSDRYQSNTTFYGAIASDFKQVGTLFEALREGKELSGAIHWRR